MHSLDDIAAVVEHPSNVLRVYSTREVGVAVVFVVPTCRAYSLESNNIICTTMLITGETA